MNAGEKLQDLNAYLDRGFSFIPTRGKALLNRKDTRDWVGEYSQRQPTGKEAEGWAEQFDYFALLSGRGLGMLDVDGKSKELRGLGQTACYSTQTPGHFRLAYTMSDPIPSQRISKTLELFGYGGTCWAMAPPSPLCEWRIPLSDIQPFPMEKLRPYLSAFTSPWPLWNYHGHDRDCIRQILGRQLEANQERNKALHTLGVLLLQEENEQSYMERILREKNAALRSPLKANEINTILHSLRRNRYDDAGCNAVKRSLPWMNCRRCLIPERRVKMTKEGRLLIAMEDLAEDPTAIVVFARILADDLEPPYNISEIARKAQLTRKTAGEKVRKLEARGFLAVDSRSQPLSF